MNLRASQDELYPANPFGRSSAQEIGRLERALIDAAMEWWNHSLAEPQRLILLRTIDALMAAKENQ